MRWKWTLVAVLVALGSPAWAQMQSRPTDPPLVTAANESWYLLREPVQFAGDLYYPAGPPLFFNGNTMVRSGHYNGVPLYTDTTVEPFSVVLVPVSRGLLQPYTRLQIAQPGMLMAPVPPTSPPLAPGAVSVYTPEAFYPVERVYAPEAIATVGAFSASPPIAGGGHQPPLTDVLVSDVTSSPHPTGVPLVTMRRPESNDGVWIMFGGEKWVSAGTAVPLVGGDFVRVGEYAGFPVFARPDFQQEVIYLPSLGGMVAPYRLKHP
jgi:hypothetical protein